jgi:IS4 transposase
MAWILLRFDRSPTVWTQRRADAMPHQNTVFHSILKLVPWSAMERLVDQFGTNKHVRRLTTQNQLAVLLYGQLAGADSLRAMEAGFESHAARLYHLGACEVSRSALSDANAKRSYKVFTGLLAELMARHEGAQRRELADAVYLMDSTVLRLNSLSADWARFSDRLCGAKLHVVYNPDSECPSFAEVTPQAVNDITVAKIMPIRAGATYVFDLGYYDYAWWAELNAAGCRLVTRLKSNTKLAVVEQARPLQGSGILSDCIGHLPPRQAKSRKNPFQDPVREVRVRAENGTILRIITNDLDASATEIADLYKRRWQVELFFRWIKHTLKIRHFFGTSENAVRIQIAVALIVYLLVRSAHALQSNIKSLLTFTRLIAQNLMHRRPIDRLLDPPLPFQKDQQQYSLSLCQN